MLSDPIAALATPPGRSALAVIRLSGTGAFPLANQIIRGFTMDPPRRANLAAFYASDGELIDRGIYVAFPGPQSYTGEDLVELPCHGGLQVPGRCWPHCTRREPVQPRQVSSPAVRSSTASSTWFRRRRWAT